MTQRTATFGFYGSMVLCWAGWLFLDSTDGFWLGINAMGVVLFFATRMHPDAGLQKPTWLLVGFLIVADGILLLEALGIYSLFCPGSAAC